MEAGIRVEFRNWTLNHKGDLPRRREAMSGGSRRLRCGFLSRT